MCPAEIDGERQGWVATAQLISPPDRTQRGDGTGQEGDEFCATRHWASVFDRLPGAAAAAGGGDETRRTVGDHPRTDFTSGSTGRMYSLQLARRHSPKYPLKLSAYSTAGDLISEHG